MSTFLPRLHFVTAHVMKSAFDAVAVVDHENAMTETNGTLVHCPEKRRDAAEAHPQTIRVLLRVEMF